MGDPGNFKIYTCWINVSVDLYFTENLIANVLQH